MQTTSITRRASLGGTATVCVATTSAATPTAARPIPPAFGDMPPDAALFAAFDGWIERQRAIEAAAPSLSAHAMSAALDVADRIMQEIAALPARSAAGFAVKAYLQAHNRYGGTADDVLRVDLPECDAGVEDAMYRSAYADALRWLPVLSEGRV
ncbi:hypothetical protein [Azospirillum sp. TSO22-1]|uniref:hypothetical protein n=1 Tax=Azospirillum sp. TSO22-1 TaxID=716789 RepID=UPI000D604252|nr:hypothetical protein [Azospirillum sp. TSO22-1]PWC53629.1 hypothetical protein TSO221_10400 [Azospirillum sp. TSO22-1]